MEVLIAIIWFLLSLAIPLALIITSYDKYLNGGRVFEIVARLILSFILYFCITIGTSWLMFLMIFVGAHTDPVGEALSFKGRLLYCAVLFFYAFIGWLLCSIVNGRFIKPSRIFSWKSDKPLSILDR
jgi:hypothetical protein